MKHFNLFKLLLIFVVFVNVFPIILVPAYADCTWNGSAIQITDVDDSLIYTKRISEGKSPDIEYEIEAGLNNLLVVEDPKAFSFGNSNGKIDSLFYKSSYKEGTVQLKQKNTTMSVDLSDGVYKMDLPNNVIQLGGPCPEAVGISVGGTGAGIQIYKKEFTVGQGSKEIGQPSMTNGQTKLDLNIPHTDIVDNFYYYIKATDPSLTGEGYEKTGTTSGDSIVISDLMPYSKGGQSTATATGTASPTGTATTAPLPPVEYQVVVYFDCGTGNLANCTFRGGDNLKFTKTQITNGDSESDIANQSNNGVEACRGDLTCVNCVVRKADGSKFESYADAANTVYNSGSYLYTNHVYTAIGCVDTSQQGVVVRMIQIGLGISGGVILIRIGAAVAMLQSGEPAKIQEGQETMTAAIIALLILVFAGIGIRFLGINLFGVLSPGTIETTSGDVN